LGFGIAIIYYAFNKNISDSTVRVFQQALNQTKVGKGADGISDFEKVLYRYLPVLYGRSNTTSHQIMDLVNSTSADIERNASGTFINISAGAYNFKDNPDIALFVIDTKALVMAHSSRPGLVGFNEINRADVSGKRFIEAMVVGALKNGEGLEDYIYSDPNKTGLYYKTAYYRLARGSDGQEYIVGCIDYKEEGSKSR
jgi:polar amino acid transport system substrate-binding protein